MTEVIATPDHVRAAADRLSEVANCSRAGVVQEPVATVRGRILAVNVVKGFALIAGEDGREYFFHCSEFKGPVHWRRALRPEVVVEFEAHDNSAERKLNPRRRDIAKNVVALL